MMATEFTSLIIGQTNRIDSLKHVLINFKKLGKANFTVPNVQGRLTDLKELWSQVQSQHNQICCNATPDERKEHPYFVNDQFYEEVYIESADYFYETIIKKAESEFCNKSTDSSYRDVHSHIVLQLPRISLPKFSGNYLEWETFRNTFESLVASNEVLSNTQKFHYLKSSLSGDAALLIANLKISDTNYESAWQLLMKEYDDKQALVHAHTHSFTSLPSMKNEN